jgi:hypothetical protein
MEYVREVLGGDGVRGVWEAMRAVAAHMRETGDGDTAVYDLASRLGATGRYAYASDAEMAIRYAMIIIGEGINVWRPIIDEIRRDRVVENKFDDMAVELRSRRLSERLTRPQGRDRERVVVELSLPRASSAELIDCLVDEITSMGAQCDALSRPHSSMHDTVRYVRTRVTAPRWCWRRLDRASIITGLRNRVSSMADVKRMDRQLGEAIRHV